MRDRIGYLHVPKAAGSSVTDAIRRAVLAGLDQRPVSVCPQVMDRTLYGDFDRYGELSGKARSMIFTGPPAELSAHDVIVGHFSASSLDHGRTGEDLAVLFREPRARLISHYAYWGGWSETEHAAWDPYDASRLAAALPWQEFLVAASIASQTDNVAARLLLAPHPLIPPDGFIAARDVDRLRDEALAALDGFGFVDAIEHGAACWSRLGHWAGLAIDVGRHNVTESGAVDPGRWAHAETPDAIRALAARTAIDRDLWRSAMRRHAGATGETDVVVHGDEIAVNQLRKVSGGTLPRGATWTSETRRDPVSERRLVGSAVSRRAGRKAGRAWQRVLRRPQGG